MTTTQCIGGGGLDDRKHILLGRIAGNWISPEFGVKLILRPKEYSMLVITVLFWQLIVRT